MLKLKTLEILRIEAHYFIKKNLSKIVWTALVVSFLSSNVTYGWTSFLGLGELSLLSLDLFPALYLLSFKCQEISQSSTNVNIFLASLFSGTSSSFVTNAFLVYIVNLLTFTEFLLLSILSLPNVDMTSHPGLTYRFDPNFPSIITYFFFPGHFFSFKYFWAVI